MFPLRRISGFFVFCLILYALLMTPQLKLMDAYRGVFSSGGNLLFRNLFGSNSAVTFTQISNVDHMKDTTIRMEKLRPPPLRPHSMEVDIKCVYAGYRPTAFAVALILATPVPWRRRVWALLWGLLLINIFVAFRVGLWPLLFFSHPSIAVVTLGPSTRTVLEKLFLVFYRAPEMHYIVPAFVWLLVTFRRDDLQRMLTRGGWKAGPETAKP
jgi:hypothetical protein